MTAVWIVVSLLVVLTHLPAAFGAVFAYGLDTSGSMRGKRFEAARSALIREFDSLRPGDVALVYSFDVVARPLGRISVAEDRTVEGRDDLENKINALKPRGLFTNLDEIVIRLKLAVFEERTPGARVIAVISDGLSDPDQYHQRVDIAALGKMVPQNSGIALYLISLPEDLTHLFGVQPDPASGTVSAPELPHIKGIAFDQSSSSGVTEALAKIQVPLPTQTSMPTNTPTRTMAPTATRTGTATVASTSTHMPTATCSATPMRLVPAATSKRDSRMPLLPFVLAGVIATAGGSILLLRNRQRAVAAAFRYLLLAECDGLSREIAVDLHPGDEVTVGKSADLALDFAADIPDVAFVLSAKSTGVMVISQDRVSLNGRELTTPAPVGVGDEIVVRDQIRIVVYEGEQQ